MGFLLLLIVGAGFMLAGGAGSKDPPMSPEVAANFNQLMTNPNIAPEVLEAAAASFDAGGFHDAANKLRARAQVLRAQRQQGGQPGFPGIPGIPDVPGGPPPGLPNLPGTPPPGGTTPVVVPPSGDPALPPDVQTMVNQLLTDPHADPSALETAAIGADAVGAHQTAAALRARAALLRGMPAPAPGPSPNNGPLNMPGPNHYTIKSGDTGVGIAKKFTGDQSRWKELLTANPDLHTETRPINGVNTTLIVPFNPGQVLNLPASWPALPQF